MSKATRTQRAVFSVLGMHRTGARLSGGVYVTGKSKSQYQECGARSRRIRGRLWWQGVYEALKKTATRLDRAEPDDLVCR